MQSPEIASNIEGSRDSLDPQLEASISKPTKHRSDFMPVYNRGKRRVPGLWIRNGRYYAQLWVDTGNGKKSPRRIALFNQDNEPARSLHEAKEARDIKRHERRENTLPSSTRKPLLADYCETYFSKATVQRKRQGTLENERQALRRWCDYLGHIRIDRISTPLVSAYVDRRLKGGMFGNRTLAAASERTANLDLLMLRNVLNSAVEDGHLREVPKMPKLDPPPPPKRQLLRPEEFEHLIDAALAACVTNGQQLVDYLQFLAFSGSREQEALRIKIVDVELERGRVVIGSDGLSKNWESRTVEFNARLEALLRDMLGRRPPDSSWLFPSPRRGDRDEHAKSFRESFKIARRSAGLEWVGFHDLRHYFCSMCVMAGIDFLTVATWLGHKDGGILVGKVYGHLLDEHRQRAAGRVHFQGVY
jgi:integrase